MMILTLVMWSIALLIWMLNILFFLFSPLDGLQHPIDPLTLFTTRIIECFYVLLYETIILVAAFGLWIYVVHKRMAVASCILLWAVLTTNFSVLSVYLITK